MILKSFVAWALFMMVAKMYLTGMVITDHELEASWMYGLQIGLVWFGFLGFLFVCALRNEQKQMNDK